MAWSDLAAAFALYLVLEGVLPFVNPQALKRVLQAVSGLGDAELRVWGLASMIAGIVLLYFVRG
jgi:uncharacterized protein YjeT (DUF2065 family)